MSVKRDWHAVSQLLNGDVLVTGGADNSYGLASTELYNPTTAI